MASYLSYFTSNSSAAPSQQQYNQAQPANSTWANTFSSRIATLRKALTKDSEDDDPDNEDCSHVSNVLRAYYTQKGRPLPEWLPPDPKKPQAPPQQLYTQYSNASSTLTNQYSGQSHSRMNSGGRGGLSDLWDSQPIPASQPQSQSLRSPRPTPGLVRAFDQGVRQASQGSAGSPDPYSQPSPGVRPLPSQRAGSFQNAQAATTTSKADRLRARLQGGGGSGQNSPALSATNSLTGTESFTRQESNASNPYMSASQPWTTNDGVDERNLGAGVNSRGFGNTAYRPRPGGPR